MLAVLARNVPMQWTGQWLTDAIQSPQHRFVVDYLTLLSEQREREARELFVRIEPAYRAFADLQRPYLERRAHPWSHMKYYQWCVGGNGGLLRPNQEGTGPLDAAARASIRATYASIGIVVPDDDASFDAGRAQG
jgi:4-hydroxy-tetrahydrodipicolinate synthase